MPKDDRVRLLHMRDAAAEVMGFVKGRKKEDLAVDRQLLLAIVKDVEIIGEAASRVTEPTRKAHPEIAWQEIVQMRNRLIHAYFDIDRDVVWDTATRDVPALAGQIEKVLGPGKN